jgi:hypothetical protein
MNGLKSHLHTTYLFFICLLVYSSFFHFHFDPQTSAGLCSWMTSLNQMKSCKLIRAGGLFNRALCWIRPRLDRLTHSHHVHPQRAPQSAVIPQFTGMELWERAIWAVGRTSLPFTVWPLGGGDIQAVSFREEYGFWPTDKKNLNWSSSSLWANHIGNQVWWSLRHVVWLHRD